MTKEFNETWYIASVRAPVQDRVSKHVYYGWLPCVDWCREQFGDNELVDYKSAKWNFIGDGVFEFRDEQDYTLFLLRWS